MTVGSATPMWRLMGGLFAAVFVAACRSGGGDESFVDPNDPNDPNDPWWLTAGQGQDLPANDEDAARFLHQATFGPTETEMTGLNYAGFDAWFEHQLSLAPSLHRPRVEARLPSGIFSTSLRHEEWWRAAVRGPDQLRQRMAFALSEILVVSQDAGALEIQALGCAEYYDMLVRGAFGNYRDLLEGVTKSPVMGIYLSHLRNEKADPNTGIRPDENYARELMQLFTIGLIELNADGTPVLDGFGDEIPTYDQTDIEELARVMTGWNYGGATNWQFPQANFLTPMEPWASYHDDGAKTIAGGALIPAGLTPEQDLDAALDVLFEHSSTGPFVSRRLIQRLVTSNPSPAYIGRVAAVFADDGQGVRGNLEAVVRAILMDTEARNGHVNSPATFGKIREPLIQLAGMWRLFEASSFSGNLRYAFPQFTLGQGPLNSPTVFNFFEPDYSPSGIVANAGLVAPELQIATHTSVTNVANQFYNRIHRSYPGYPTATEFTVFIHLDAEMALAGTPAELVDHLDLFLLGGQMSSQMRSALIAHVGSVALNADGLPNGMRRVQDAIYLIVTSPEGALQL